MKIFIVDNEIQQREELKLILTGLIDKSNAINLRIY